MNIKSCLASAAFVVAALAAHAQVATGFGDLVLGFTNGANNQSVLVDLGSISNVAAPGTYTFGNLNLNSALTAAFGSWAADSSITWGVAANAGSPTPVGSPTKNTQWLTSAWDTATAGTLGLSNSTAYNKVGSGTLGTSASKTGTVYTALSSADAGQTSGNIVTTGTGVWSASSPFNLQGALFNNSVTSLALGQSYSAADLYAVAAATPAVTSGTVTLLGTFALGSNGDVSYTVFQAIPEPTTYAAILGIATLGFVAIRRRKQAQLLA